MSLTPEPYRRWRLALFWISMPLGLAAAALLFLLIGWL
jgi:hypothetical protein